MNSTREEINEFLCKNLELVLRAFKGDHKTKDGKALVKLLRKKFKYSDKTASLDIFRVAKDNFIKKNHYEHGAEFEDRMDRQDVEPGDRMYKGFTRV
jgi:hypothetical protein